MLSAIGIVGAHCYTANNPGYNKETIKAISIITPLMDIIIGISLVAVLYSINKNRATPLITTKLFCSIASIEIIFGPMVLCVQSKCVDFDN